MKLKKLIRYIEDTAPPESVLRFYDASDDSFSTDQAEFVSGAVAEKDGLLRASRISLSLRASASGVPLLRDGFLGWLRGLADSYGDSVQVLLRLHGGNGRGSQAREMLSDDMWSRIEHQGEGRYALTEPTEVTLQYTLLDAIELTPPGACCGS